MNKNESKMEDSCGKPTEMLIRKQENITNIQVPGMTPMGECRASYSFWRIFNGKKNIH